MSEISTGLFDKLCQSMEEEIFFYHLLAEELKKESDFLRKGSTDSLLSSLRSLEVHTREVRKIHEATQRIVQKMLAMKGREGEESLPNLLALLAPAESQRIKDYQRTLGALKKRITQVNARNKTFAQGSLDFWRDLYSLLTQPLAESRVYIQNGKTQSPTHLPISLNRKV
jgi:flagellar biosynthesis/type III secretory pathway chaperone